MSDFRLDAACRDADPELFFPIGNGVVEKDAIDTAKVICRRCPVMEKCLSWALTNRQIYGVWGGTDEVERRALLVATRPGWPPRRAVGSRSMTAKPARRAV